MPRFGSREEYEAWKSGQAAPATAPPEPARGTPASLAAPPPAAKPKHGLKEAFSDLPGWAWPFIVASFAIPVISMGGAIPGALGFGAAAGCASVAKKADWETMPRVLACAGIAGSAWIVFLAFAAFLASRG